MSTKKENYSFTINSDKDREILGRLATDKKYFVETMLFIIDKDRKRVPFMLNPLQERYYNNLSNLDIILKARKEGFSSFIAALFLHACIFEENTRAVIVSHEQKATSRLLEKIKYYISTSLFPIRTEKNSEYEISFPDTNSTFYVGTAGQKAFGRGDDITHAHLSEFCFYEKPDIITAIKEAGTNNLKMVLESTANGAGNFSHEMWIKAIKKESAYKPHFFAWWENPEYAKKVINFHCTEEENKIRNRYNLTLEQMKWRRETIREMPNQLLFQQEYPDCWEEAFLTSGKMIFDFEALQNHERFASPVKYECDIVEERNKIKLQIEEKAPFKIWKNPREKINYLVTSDSADGVTGGDYSVGDVWDMATWEQVAQYRGHINPDEFGDKLQLIGKYYNNAVIMPEVNIPGNSTYDRLVALGYPNLWIGDDGKPFRTTSKTRALVISAARKCITEMSIKINSTDTINECRTYVLNTAKKYEAAHNCFDDCVVSLSLGCYALQNIEIDKVYNDTDDFGLTIKDKHGIIDSIAPGKNQIV